MITNLFIDASVLAFPPEVDNKDEDCENIKKYLRNMKKLIQIFEDRPNVTVSVRHYIEADLAAHGYDFTFNENQRQRWNTVMKNDPRFDIDIKDISKFYSEKIFNDKQTIRFNNESAIQNIDKSALKNYHESAKICTEKFFEDEFKKLVSYISRMDEKYEVGSSCCIALCGKGQDYQEKKICITRVKKVYERYKNSSPFFDTLEGAYQKVKEETKENILFGDNIENNPNISIVYNESYNNPSIIPNKIYHYLTTLANAAKKIDTLKADEKTIDQLLNLFGCNSAPENKNNNYPDCPYRRWHDGEKESQFLLHLRPTSEPYNKTTRIYYKYSTEQKKFVVGMILDHPPNCPDCNRKEWCSSKYTIGSAMQGKRSYKP